MKQSVKTMTDDEIRSEIQSLDKLLGEMADDLVESGGMSGSPGEWIDERIEELETEKRRRLISLDGDIGRRKAR